MTPLSNEVSVNIEGGECNTECGFANAQKANTDDCKTTYDALYNKATAFTLDPRKLKPKLESIC